VKNRLTYPYFPSLCYSNTYDAALVVETLKKRKKGKIGIVGKGRISIAFYEHRARHYWFRPDLGLGL
jgi:hypothetical protein